MIPESLQSLSGHESHFQSTSCLRSSCDPDAPHLSRVHTSDILHESVQRRTRMNVNPYNPMLSLRQLATLVVVLPVMFVLTCSALR